MPESLNHDHVWHAKDGESAEVETLRVRVAALEAACAEGLQSCCEAQHSLQTFITRSPVAIVLLDIETGRFLEANLMAEQLFGFPRTALLKMGPAEVSPPCQPDGSSSTRANAMIALAVGGGDPVFEWWHRNARGERIPCEIGLARVRWSGRDVIRGTIVDISARKKLELSERGRRRLLESIACGANLQATLGELVSAIEGLLPGMLCSILLLDHETNCLRLRVAPSLPDLYNAAVDGLPIGPTAGSCGAAAFLGERVIVSDVADHPNWISFRQFTEQAQLRACWSEPILSFAGQVLGTFAMYYREPGEPARVELDAIETAAQLAALAIEYANTQRAIQESKETLEYRVAEQTAELTKTNQELRAAEEDMRLSAVAFHTHDSIIITDQNGRILRVNRSFTKLTGYSLRDVIGKTPRILRSGRHDGTFYCAMWDAIRTAGYWEGEIWNRRKDGHVYLQRLTITCVKNASGETTHYVGDGQDITQEKVAALDRAAIQAARNVQESLLPAESPNIPGFDIAGAVHPADCVSGDFFDFMAVGPTFVCVLVADVSGHGLGPALLMAQTQAYLHALAGFYADPGELLTHTNRLFALSHSGHFVTLLLCRLDAKEQSLSYAAAGHQGYLVRADGSLTILESTSIPLGFESNTIVPCGPRLAFAPGDILVLLTDGIEEAESPDHRLFGLERAIEVVRASRGLSATQIVESLLCAARDFTQDEPQRDDITAVVVKMLDV